MLWQRVNTQIEEWEKWRRWDDELFFFSAFNGPILLWQRVNPQREEWEKWRRWDDEEKERAEVVAAG